MPDTSSHDDLPIAYVPDEPRMRETPDELRGIVKCANPKCITNNEPMPTLFHVKDREAGVIRCHYCEKEQNLEHVKLVNS